MYEILKENNKIIAYLIDFNKIERNKSTVEFITETSLPFQLSFFNFIGKKHILPHIHLKNIREIYNTSEFIFVLKGKIKINIFNTKEQLIKKLILQDNQAILQFIGGHEFFIEPNTVFFELKQGPYSGKNKDKKILDK